MQLLMAFVDSLKLLYILTITDLFEILVYFHIRDASCCIVQVVADDVKWELNMSNR